MGDLGKRARAERRPSAPWVAIDASRLQAPSGKHSAWQSGPVCVVSSLIDAELPDRSGIGPQWYISISNRGRRPKNHHVRRALRAFRMKEAEEDNHHPGNARHFFLTVDPAHRVDCSCKEDEITRTEPDGYKWQDAVDHCRGCDLEGATGKPCSRHRPAGDRG